MDSISQIPSNKSSDDAVTLALDNLSLTEVSSNVSLCSHQKDSVTEATLNTRPDINCNETSKTKQLAITQNEVKAPFQSQDCALTILDDCCSSTNNEVSLDSTYVVPRDMGNSFRDSSHDKMKIDFVIRQNSHSNSHQQPNSSHCIITLYESSESDSTIQDSDSSYDSESSTWLEYNKERELSYTIKRQSLSSDGESTEELSSDSEEESSDAHENSDDSQEISNESGEDSNDSDQDSSDSDSDSVNDDSDEEPTPSDDESAEDSDEDSSTTSEEKQDSDEESEPCNDNGSTPIESSEDDESSDDDRSVDLDESSSESSSESSEDSD